MGERDSERFKKVNVASPEGVPERDAFFCGDGEPRPSRPPGACPIRRTVAAPQTRGMHTRSVPVEDPGSCGVPPRPPHPGVSRRDLLRHATRPAHAALDRLVSDWMSSSLAAYTAFLEAHRCALAWLEPAIEASGASQGLPDWPARKRLALVEEDLAALGASSRHSHASGGAAKLAEGLGMLLWSRDRRSGRRCCGRAWRRASGRLPRMRSASSARMGVTGP